VTAGTGMEEIGASLKGCKVVLIPAGVPRKPGMTRDDLFNINAGLLFSITYCLISFWTYAVVASPYGGRFYDPLSCCNFYFNLSRC
jgi:malate/lactate dehydrogenase